MIAAPARMTEEQFLHLPQDGRKWELVQGEPKEVPAGHEHDVIGFWIGAMLMPFARGRGVVAGSQAGFRMASGNVRSPDVAFTRRERMENGRPAKGFENFAPDLAIEIISPSEDSAEMAQKVAEYFQSGAEQVWHVFPDTRRVTVYHSLMDTQTLSETETLTGGALLPGFSVTVSELFALE